MADHAKQSVDRTTLGVFDTVLAGVLGIQRLGAKSGEQATMSETDIYLAAGGVVIALLLIVEVIARLGHRAIEPRAMERKGFLTTVVLGADGRTSTSKTFVFMWTLLIGWALIALLIAGEFVHTHGCVLPEHLTQSLEECKGKKDEVGLLQVGWLNFLHAGVSGSYMLLLGVPAAAAVAAKGITQSQATGTGFKTPNTNAGPALTSRLSEIFSADDGTTDIGDFQYMVFNVIAAAYFVVQFVNPHGTGLPNMPETLLGLTSVSAGLYVGKKAVTRSQPKVTGIFPQPVQANCRFTILGEGLTAEATAPTEVPPQITIDGVAAMGVSTENETLTAVLPPAFTGSGAPKVLHLQVKNPYGGITPIFEIQCL
jgi:hypothetical protein